MLNPENQESLHLKWMIETSEFLANAQKELDSRDRLIKAFWTGSANGDENGDASLEECIMAQWGRQRLIHMQKSEG